MSPAGFEGLACVATPVVVFLLFVALTVARAHVARRTEDDAFGAALADLGATAVRFDLSDSSGWPDAPMAALEELGHIAQQHGHAWLIPNARDLARNHDAIDVRVLAARIDGRPVARLGSARPSLLLAWVDGAVREQEVEAGLMPPPALARRLESLGRSRGEEGATSGPPAVIEGSADHHGDCDEADRRRRGPRSIAFASAATAFAGAIGRLRSRIHARA